MKQERGVTLTALVIYVIVATILISTIAMVSSFFFTNMYLIKDVDDYAIEFNTFSMFLINDVKSNTSATVTTTTITFEDGTVYTYNSTEKAVYRDDVVIAQNVDGVNFSLSEETVSNTTKQIITAKVIIDGNQNATNGIEYVLKYW